MLQNRLARTLAAPALTLGALAIAGPTTARERPDGEAELAEILEGRVAGEPVRCISDASSRSMRIVDGTAFVFRSGRTIYVNRPDGAQFLDQWDVPVFKLYGQSRLCDKTWAELRDRSISFGGPTVVLNEFIPYRKPD